MKPVTGTLDHRILLNYRADPEVMARALPDCALVMRGLEHSWIARPALDLPC